MSKEEGDLDTSQTRLWTDGLQICNYTGVGFSVNQVYKTDGSRHEQHKSRDKKCFCKVNEYDISLYAIFSGFGGSAKVAEFALQKIAADMLLGQLNGKASEESVKEVIRQAFQSVERGYLDSIDSRVAKKTSLQLGIPDGVSQLEIAQKYKDVLDQLNAIQTELSVGANGLTCLIYKSKIYVGNIGSCRTLLAKSDEFNNLHVSQISVDHNLYNEDESLRLCQIGLDIQNFEDGPLRWYSTRCFGNYLGKAGYKDCDFLSASTGEPIIFAPDITCIPIDASCRFLVLLSSGLVKTLYDIYPGDINEGNKLVIRMIAEEFKNQSTLNSVAQAVVHRLICLHHDAFMEQVEEGGKIRFNNREDITLLIRNFDYPMPNAFTNRKHTKSVSSTTSTITSETSQSGSTVTENDTTSVYTATNTSVSTSTERNETDNFDGERKIKPYIDFSDYYKRVEEARKMNKLPKDIIFD